MHHRLITALTSAAEFHRGAVVCSVFFSAVFVCNYASHVLPVVLRFFLLLLFRLQPCLSGGMACPYAAGPAVLWRRSILVRAEGLGSRLAVPGPAAEFLFLVAPLSDPTCFVSSFTKSLKSYV